MSDHEEMGWDRAEELARKLDAMTVRAEAAERAVQAANSECAALRAEVERLRAEDERHVRHWQSTVDALAAANACVKSALEALVSPPMYSAKVRCSDILRAHLSAQPAAPSEQLHCHPDVIIRGEKAAPTRPTRIMESGQGVTIRAVSVTPQERAALNVGAAWLPSAPTRAAAEQRVLDAMAAVGRGRLRHIIEAEISSLSEAAEAELARREGK